MEQGLDGGEGNVEMFGDLLVAPALLLAQPEHFAMPRREPVHGFSEVAAIDRSEQLVVVVLDHTEVDVRRGLDSRCLPVMVDAEALRDDGHPRVEAPFAGEAGHRPQRTHEGLLCQLF